MVPGKLQAPMLGRFARHLQHSCILSWFGARIAAEGKRIAVPEPGNASRRVDTFGECRRHLGKAVPEGLERGRRVAVATLAAQVVGYDAGITRLSAARVPQILQTEIGIESPIRRRNQA